MNIFSRDKHIAVIAELCGGLGVPVAPDTNARYVSLGDHSNRVSREWHGSNRLIRPPKRNVRAV